MAKSDERELPDWYRVGGERQDQVGYLVITAPNGERRMIRREAGEDATAAAFRHMPIATGRGTWQAHVSRPEWEVGVWASEEDEDSGREPINRETVIELRVAVDAGLAVRLQ